MDTVGERLRFYRKARKLKQEQLAERAGIAQTMVSSIETGARAGSLEVLNALAKALDIPVASLVDGTLFLPTDLAALQGSVPDESLAELAAIWPDLTEDDRQTALKVARALWSRRAPHQQAQQAAS